MYHRKSPEEILDSIAKLRRGRLKIIIGAFSGSGKTYHMLQEGRQLKQQGIDVVVSAVSAYRQPDTAEQLAEFDRVPSIHWRKGGLERKDLDLDAIMARNPEVVLVDGLAHRNRPEAKHRTRLDDIRFLMEHGISVITTANVYELAEADEIAAKWTGIRCQETVPADTLELADEIRLIDVSPETMLKRLEEGVAGDSQGPVLSRGNLAVLRELSLRLVAEGVGESLAKHREELGLSAAVGAQERILVSAQYHWNGSLHVRRGEQIARRLNGDLMVLTFVNPKKPLAREQLTFKRSIVKLTDKVGGSFEELPMRGRRSLPRALVRYAAEHRATRIVMGHSNESWRSQLLYGNLAARVLRLAEGIDLYLMTDRAMHEGERILPVMQKESAQRKPFRRASPEDVAKSIGAMRRGTFKVYIGAAPGVGKTYTMLREGNILLRKGVDVVIGLLETHGRRETEEQVGELPIVPRAVVNYQGVRLEEMDTDAIIARNPEVALVDELAHTNVPGSVNKKRYDDVIRLLEHGISVIATMNVQHLESLNDAVEQLTGVRVRETVPDAMLRLADEVELIDVTPQMLRQRMREGKIYAADKVEQALSAFFTTANLIALRELALREIADDVDERLEAWDRRSSLRGPLRRREVIVVAVDLQPHSERLIRRGFRIAFRLKAEWQVLHIRTGGGWTEEEARKAESLSLLTKRLGGQFLVEEAGRKDRVAERLVQAANAAGATQLIVGQSGRRFPGFLRLFRPGVIRTLLRTARHMDVLIAAQ